MHYGCKSILIMLCHSVFSTLLLDFWMQLIKLIKKGGSPYFPCNTITLGGTSKPIAFLHSGNDSDDYLLQPHFVWKNFFFFYFSCLL